MRSDPRLITSSHQHRAVAAKAAPALSQQRWFAYTAGATLLVGALLACIGSNAQAQTPAASGAPTKYAAQEIGHAFSLIDTNNNGSISRSEAVAFRKVANYFDAADSNRDGALSPQEFETALNGGKPQ